MSNYRHTINMCRGLLESELPHLPRDTWMALVDAADEVLVERDLLEAQVEQLLEGTRADTADIATLAHTLREITK